MIGGIKGVENLLKHDLPPPDSDAREHSDCVKNHVREYIKNAGGLYVDKPVAVDGNVITSRKLTDVADFSEAIIRALSDVTTGSN